MLDGVPRSLSVLIVSWRTREVTLRTVQLALEATEGLEAEVLVVDNASGDGTAEELQRRFGNHPRVRLLRNDANRGFAAGNNQAFEASTGEIVVVCNPDLHLSSAALGRLVDLSEDPSIGIATGCLIGADGVPQTLHRSFPDLMTVAFTMTRAGAVIDHRLLQRRHQRRYRLLDRPRVGLRDIDQAAGALLLLRRDVVLGPLGGVLFDEALPILVNDVDLSRRVHDAGLRVVVDWDTALLHDGGVSLRQLPEVDRREMRWAGLERYFQVHESRWRLLLLRLLRRFALEAPPSTPFQAADDGRPVATSEAAPHVSIVIPAYNYADYLSEAIDSALAQSYENTEVLVVDDGSTDETPEVLASYSDRIAVHRQENAGLSAARNTGARLAHGELLVYLDADNRLRPNFVQRCVQQLCAHPAAGFAYPQVAHVGALEHTTALDSYDLDTLLAGNTIDACCLVRRELVLAHPYDEANRTGWEDWDFFLTLAEHGWGGVLVDEVLLEYRRHEASMTSAIDALARRRLRLRILWRHRRLVGLHTIAMQWGRLQRIRLGLLRRRVLR